ncbi:MAG: porin, partial [Leptospiraceae bacterium]|nr:porin [Leptospiraceae bacterium]
MKNKCYKKIVLYFPFFLLSYSVLAEEKEEKKWYDTVNYSGYVDVYYKYATNNKQGN